MSVNVHDVMRTSALKESRYIFATTKSVFVTGVGQHKV